MVRWFKRFGPLETILVLGFTSILLSLPALYVGRFIFDSADFNTSWSDGFAKQLALGEIYPRWLPHMNDGMGSAVFYFYAPVPFYISGAAVLLTGDPSFSVVLGSSVMLGLSGGAGYLLLRHYAGRPESLLAAAVYMSLPYHYQVDMWLRSAYGEQAAFIFMPLALLCILRLDRGVHYAAGVALSCAGLALSHIPLTLVFAPVMVVFSLWQAIVCRSLRVLSLAAIGGFLGAGAAGIYLIPAWFGRYFIKPEMWTATEPIQHLLFNGIAQPLSSMLQVVFTAASLQMVLILLLIWHRRRVELAALVPWIAVAAITMFLITSPSRMFWENAGPYRIIQFPWRMLAVGELILSIFLVVALKVDRKVALYVLPPVVLVFLAHSLAAIGPWLVSNPVTQELLKDGESQYRQLISFRSDALEYLPSCMDMPAELTDGDIRTLRILKHYRGLETPESTLRMFYYPFLHVYADGRELATSCDPATGFIRAEGLPDDISGVLVRREPLPVERWALLCSLVSLFFILLLAIIPVFSRVKSAPGPVLETFPTRLGSQVNEILK